MKDLLDYLITKMLGLKEVQIEETTQEGYTQFLIKTKPGEAGLVIGKEGRTIKAIRNLLKVRATLEKKGVNVSVEETS